MNDTPLHDPALALLAPFARHDGAQAGLALYQVIMAMHEGVLGVSEASLAQVKLAWWEQELDRLLAGRPQHPDCKALFNTGRCDRLDAGELKESLESLSIRLQAPIYSHEDELLLHAWRSEGAAAVCAARLAGADTQSTRQSARDLGMARALARLVNEFESERQANRCWLPSDWLSEAGSDHQQLLNTCPEATLRVRILAPVARLAEQRFQTAWTAARQDPQRQALLVPGLLAVQELNALRRAQRQDYRPRPPGPLRRLFTVWRSARQFS